jgi:hypothetical protein
MKRIICIFTAVTLFIVLFGCAENAPAVNKTPDIVIEFEDNYYGKGEIVLSEEKFSITFSISNLTNEPHYEKEHHIEFFDGSEWIIASPKHMISYDPSDPFIVEPGGREIHKSPILAMSDFEFVPGKYRFVYDDRLYKEFTMLPPFAEDLGLIIELEKDSFTLSELSKISSISVRNHSNESHFEGSAVLVEHFDGDDWKQLPVRGGWDDMGLLYPPGYTHEIVFSLSMYSFDFVPGLYRLNYYGWYKEFTIS